MAAPARLAAAAAASAAAAVATVAAAAMAAEDPLLWERERAIIIAGVGSGGGRAGRVSGVVPRATGTDATLGVLGDAKAGNGIFAPTADGPTGVLGGGGGELMLSAAV